MNKELSKAYSEMAKNLHTLAKLLPKQIAEAEKNLTKEDIEKIRTVMKETGFESKLKELDTAKKELDLIIKSL